jgi:predicted ATPase/DNA-binding SARP family transcriptional activator
MEQRELRAESSSLDILGSAPPDGKLRVWLLGGFRVAVDSHAIDGQQWRRRKVANLIKLLAVAGGRLHRDQVLERLWPEFTAEAAANNLYQALHHARRILETGGLSSIRLLQIQGDVVELAPVGALWIDATAFEAAATQARQSQDFGAYQAALDLYTGDLLPDEPYEEWVTGRRETLRQTYLELLLDLARLCESRHDRNAAIDTLQRALTIDPMNEKPHVGLMRLYAQTGRRQQALRQYQSLEARLQSELSAEPDPKTRRLYRAILEGHYPTREPGSDSLAADGASRVTPPAAESPSPHPAQIENVALSRHNLPLQLTRFVGREAAKADVTRLLAASRLVTLVGPGGCGKTRLAVEIGSDVVASFSGGVWLVELAPIVDPGQVPRAVARVLSVVESSGRPLVEAIASFVKGKNLLLILDDCEHLIDATAHLVNSLLRLSPDLRILATSREPLRVPGEITWLVPSLTLPDPTRSYALADLMRFESVRLFLDRATANQASFRVTDVNATAIAQICYRLDGIPLAIELAAARVRLLPPEQIAARLDDRFRLLAGGSRTALPRHQTLRAAIDWSYNLLVEPERMVLRRLAVFAGTWSLEAAEAVCGVSGVEDRVSGEGGSPASDTRPPTPDTPLDVLDLVARLVDKSLVLVEEKEAEPRYHLLETVRQYALDELTSARELASTRQRHATYYLEVAAQTYAAIRDARQLAWLNRLEIELDNVRAVLTWAFEAGEAELALDLAGQLDRFWQYHPHLIEGRRWLQRGLATAPLAAPLVRARALGLLGWLTRLVDGPEIARPLLDEALALYLALGDQRGIADVTDSLGDVAYFSGDLDRALALHQENLVRRRGLGDRWGEAMSLNSLGWVAIAAGKSEQAQKLLEEGLAIVRELGDQRSIAMLRFSLAQMAQEQRNYSRMIAYAADALQIYRILNNTMDLALAFGLIAAGLAEFGQFESAARLFGRAHAFLQDVGARGKTTNQFSHDSTITALRTRVGEETYRRLTAEGAALDLAAACAEALAAASRYTS